MHYHAKAALTAKQRRVVQELAEQGRSHSELARRFGVHRSTIQRWAARSDATDRSSAPHQHGRQVVTETYRQAVLAERSAHPHYGPQRIADQLRSRFPSANRTTVWRILHAAGVSKRQGKKTEPSSDSSRASSSATGYSGTAGD